MVVGVQVAKIIDAARRPQPASYGRAHPLPPPGAGRFVRPPVRAPPHFPSKTGREHRCGAAAAMESFAGGTRQPWQRHAPRIAKTPHRAETPPQPGRMQTADTGRGGAGAGARAPVRPVADRAGAKVRRCARRLRAAPLHSTRRQRMIRSSALAPPASSPKTRPALSAGQAESASRAFER